MSGLAALSAAGRAAVAVAEGGYLTASVMLAVYGANSMALAAMAWRARNDPPPEPAPWQGPLPRVAVQLPLYNERHVAERAIAAAARLDYPAELLDIQVLDDSTDETRSIVAASVAAWRARGVPVRHVRRENREGFKAGALAAGLVGSDAEFIAIFDADFVPKPDFLHRTLGAFADAGVGCVQARWGELNRDYSLLTRLQALGIAGHFFVEQSIRATTGAFLNFNGTAGLWRRTCIDSAGGWAGDTLTEDLDLSYRAQLAGWRIAYLPSVCAPAEIPTDLAALRQQQRRWARGSMQTARKLLGTVLRAGRLPFAVRAHALLHLTGYAVAPLILVLLACTGVLLFAGRTDFRPLGPWPVAALGPPLMYLVAQRKQGRPWREAIDIGALTLLGIGLSATTGPAALAGLTRRSVPFERTPKLGIVGRGAGLAAPPSAYPLLRRRGAMLFEWALVALSVAALAQAIAVRSWEATSALAMYAASFLMVAMFEPWQRLVARWRRGADVAPEAAARADGAE